MTEERLALSELLEKAGDGDFLRTVAEAVLQLLMETDVEGLIGAGRYERGGERTTWRNGHRDRVFDTRLGSLQLRIPKLRQGSYFPPFLEARKVSEKALIAVIQEAWIGGVSTRRVDDLVKSMGIDVKIWPMPVEIPNPIRFDQDTTHASYDRAHAERFWRVLVAVEPIFTEFRGRFIGKDSPVHFFWGSFDLAVTRFSGRRAPERPGADSITREAYSHEVSNVGWWPGNAEAPIPTFYAYAAPEPGGFKDYAVKPGKAAYSEKMKEFLLSYEDVRTAADPRAALLDFCQSTYEAAANLGKWDRASLERSEGAASAAPAR